MKPPTHFSITQATVMSVVGAIATGVVTLVPAWSGESQIVVAAIGGVVVAAFPLVNAVHKLADSILAGRQAIAGSNVSAREVEARALAMAHSEVAHLLATADLGPAVQQAIAAQNRPALEGVGRDELNRVLQSMFPGMTQLIDQVLPVAPVPGPAPAKVISA